MITGVAHSAVCVPDVDAAVRWYTDVLGLRVLSPAYRMEGDAIERDMGDLLPSPVAVKAAILGLGDAGDIDDRVLELIEYPNATVETAPDSITHAGITHIGLVCDDIDETRVRLEAQGVEFLTTGIADVAGLRTTWFRDPWGAVFILMQKRMSDRAYWHQY